MVQILRCDVHRLRDQTGEGLMACFHAMKASQGEYEKALDFLNRSGTLVAIRPRETVVMTNRERFEAAWCKKYEWEMKRGIRGRGGYSLEQHEGVYVSDKVKFAYEIWMMAITEG